MRSSTLLTVFLAALAWGGFSDCAVAQPNPGKRFAPLARGMLQEVLQTLTPEERQEFVAARRTAINDPTVVAAKQTQQAALKEFKGVMKKAMLQQDPSLAAVFEKLEAPEPVGAASFTADGRQGEHAKVAQQAGWGALLNNLTPEERQKMRAARAAVRSQPEVQQVESRRAAADKEFRETLRASMLNSDPAAGPVIDKVEAAMKEKTRALRRGLEIETPPAAQTH